MVGACTVARPLLQQRDMGGDPRMPRAGFHARSKHCRYPPGARMHVLAYLYGVAYYVVLSLSFVPHHTVATALGLLFRVPPEAPLEQRHTAAEALQAEAVGGDCSDGTCDHTGAPAWELQDANLTTGSAQELMRAILGSIARVFMSDRMILVVRAFLQCSTAAVCLRSQLEKRKNQEGTSPR
jgi:hypothetical protein